MFSPIEHAGVFLVGLFSICLVARSVSGILTLLTAVGWVFSMTVDWCSSSASRRLGSSCTVSSRWLLFMCSLVSALVTPPGCLLKFTSSVYVITQFTEFSKWG